MAAVEKRFSSFRHPLDSVPVLNSGRESAHFLFAHQAYAVFHSYRQRSLGCSGFPSIDFTDEQVWAILMASSFCQGLCELKLDFRRGS